MYVFIFCYGALCVSGRTDMLMHGLVALVFLTLMEYQSPQHVPLQSLHPWCYNAGDRNVNIYIQMYVYIDPALALCPSGSP
jgi:hypothetical protein